MEQEILHFKIALSATLWDKLPEWSICIDDKQVCQGSVSSDKKFIEFDHSLIEGSHTLSINLLNKTLNDTVENDDKTAIVKDMLLNIESVEIDEIDLGYLIYSKSKFVGTSRARPTLTKCVNLGWNGSWILPFDTPFYLWLLENM
jgi:hypothetical protein